MKQVEEGHLRLPFRGRTKKRYRERSQIEEGRYDGGGGGAVGGGQPNEGDGRYRTTVTGGDVAPSQDRLSKIDYSTTKLVPTPNKSVWKHLVESFV